MADDDNNSYANGGTLAGSLVGAAAGVALISNPGSVLSALGVGVMASTPVAEAAVGASILSVVLPVVAMVAIGAAIGGLIVHHYHHKKETEAKVATVTGAEVTRTRHISTPALAPEQTTTVEWAKKLDQAKLAEPAMTGRGS